MKAELAEDVKWLREHSLELQERYPGMYIAVSKGEVVAADKDLRKVYNKARPHGERAIIKYIFSRDLIVLQA